MASNAPMIISTIIVGSITLLFLINKTVSDAISQRKYSPEYIWLIHGLMNILGYATVFVPGYLTYKYVKKTNYIHKTGPTLFGFAIRSCFAEDDLLTPNISSTSSTKPQRTYWQTARLLIFYICGLQVSYLSWGVLQEKVMTQPYTNSNEQVGHFKDSQFLVFVNRILAFGMSGLFLLCQRQANHQCPLYKYVFCSFSNIMSTWCQYEALKYVSFPHQVLAKAAKTIPLMIMGKLFFRSKYEYYEYVTAIILSIGMLFFMLDTGNDKATATTFAGVILLSSYIVFDSFTSNWQGKLFKTYQIRPVQMMCFVNLFSCIFTSVSLMQQDGFYQAFTFMFTYPRFIVDCVLLSICSATGQLFIFSTISNFGPLVFAFITTVRQGLSILLSCIIYHHQVHAIGVVGLILVFFSVFLRIYCGHRLKNIRKKINLIVQT